MSRMAATPFLSVVYTAASGTCLTAYPLTKTEIPLTSATPKARAMPQPVVTGMRGRTVAGSRSMVIGVLLARGIDGGADGGRLVRGDAVDDGPGGDVHPLPDREVGEQQRVRAPATPVGLDGGAVRVDRDDEARGTEAHGSGTHRHAGELLEGSPVGQPIGRVATISSVGSRRHRSAGRTGPRSARTPGSRPGCRPAASPSRP